MIPAPVPRLFALLADGDVAADWGVCNIFEYGEGLSPLETPKGDWPSWSPAPRVTPVRSSLNPPYVLLDPEGDFLLLALLILDSFRDRSQSSGSAALR